MCNQQLLSKSSLVVSCIVFILLTSREQKCEFQHKHRTQKRTQYPNWPMLVSFTSRFSRVRLYCTQLINHHRGAERCGERKGFCSVLLMRSFPADIQEGREHLERQLASLRPQQSLFFNNCTHYATFHPSKPTPPQTLTTSWYSLTITENTP